MPKIEVFSSPHCSYCEAAKKLLDDKGKGYAIYDISSDEAHRQELLHRLPRTKSVPQIFIAGEHIGGYEDLCLFAEAGRLD